MDFNSLLRKHLHGEDEGDFVPPPYGHQFFYNQPGLSYDTARGQWIDVPTSNQTLGPLGSDEDAQGGSESGLSHIWDVPTRREGSSSQRVTPSPPATAPSPSQQATISRRSSPTLIPDHRDSILQSSWFRNNEMEPPIQPNDPLVRYGLLTTEHSRFDAFIQSSGDRHSCIYVEPGSTETCNYSNFRRQRVKVHVLGHFSYKPYVCDGSCGKPDCTLGFADSTLLGDHVRRVAKPRAQCETCGAMIAPQNYRRHQVLMHGASQTDP
ncbi:hypothetical protein M408DRAFT_7806 [Serendipita vermifera MAFF 305830]|uniref:C2H2-type domain-containing protein n=1 Tax=Serendipita vermifera MAFF 305830 TaxID=933852 RepID=A0A0C2WVY9_SERVB|nr:hypothetical protein M408DRAFT_7806 [Serendipita vermifera MAFF 305830]